MSDAQPSSVPDTAALLASLDALGLELTRNLALRHESLGELRRQADALAHRRGGAGSKDARNYALGSVLTMVQLDHTTDTELLGLLAHPELMLRWAIAALAERGPVPFGDLVDTALNNYDRRKWCEQWGRVLQWRYRKPLYDAAVKSFIESGRAGPKERWRSLDVTDDQAALVTTLTALLKLPAPSLRTRGESFDWIREHGGNPTYWAEPSSPDEKEVSND